MKFKSLVLATTLALPMLSASAATAAFSNKQAHLFNDPLAVGAFTQNLSFSGLAAGVYDIFGTLNAQNSTPSMTELVTFKGFALSSATRSREESVTLVPEPESYAMLMAGLGLFGTIARRRMKASEG
ncbi:hypothetical protein J2X15_002295 [Rhodoferax saidenbachensis]|uniref:Ice-binding protein C-terminal domain-containing protein n=1 Tax=Rhodoferax saidenbachensis TaxID=1484693 RepID=A0ABU1ZN74_9BURK|nr:PEP-CTERM sorting domain-containing protein [Rhodoferax saidenbachensis]MDR7307009.1 hypothetical protein [Rhodoferax saidenbachensis]